MADEEVVVEDVVEDAVDESEGSLSEDISAAWDDSDGDDGDPAAASESPNEGDDPGAAAPATEEASADGDGAAASGQVEEAGGKPPLDWSPELREEWGGLPPAVKTQIANREAQMATAMQGTAQARRVASEFTGVANQFGSVMAAEGINNPVQMFDTVMRTVSELRMGTSQQKAAKIAELIQNYGVDVKTLDGQLSAQITGQPAPGGGNPDMEAMINQRMQPVNDMMQQLAGMQQQKQRASAGEAQQEVNAFAGSAEGEFLNDVRHDVADLIDMATRQGRQMTLQEAYGKACAMNPQIAAVLDKRQADAALLGNQRGIAGKRNAGSSLRPGNPGGNSRQGAQSLMDSINSAWDDHSG